MVVSVDGAGESPVIADGFRRHSTIKRLADEPLTPGLGKDSVRAKRLKDAIASAEYPVYLSAYPRHPQ